MNFERLQATAARTAFIGVDGGASGFRAHEVVVRGEASGLALALGSHSAAEAIEPVAGFVPLPVERQRERAAGKPEETSREERELQARWIGAASRAVQRVAALAQRRTVRVGVCAPGLKTRDGRGIEVALHGPRIPDFAAALEKSLAQSGLALAAPIDRIDSDGLACGCGEDVAESGLLRGVAHGYYLGGGSGVAECYKLDGRVCGADELDLPKAWELCAEDGGDFEVLLSVSGLNREFGLAGALPADPERLPERAAAAGDARARSLFECRAEHLAELACARLAAVHAARGIVLERVVVGQRLGLHFLEPGLVACFAARARKALAARIARSGHAALRAAWVCAGELARDRLVGSDLRAAPALGALALAIARN